MVHPLAYRAVFPSVSETVSRAAAWAEAYARAAGFSAATAERVALVAAEAVANAVTHGNRLDPLRHVFLEWTSGATEGRLSIRDDGPGPDADRIARAVLPEDPMETDGRGLFLIRSLSDGVAVEGKTLVCRFVGRAGEGVGE